MTARGMPALLGLVGATVLLGGWVPLQATLEGTVLNRASNRPVPGVRVALRASGQATFTDEVGRFSFGEIEGTEPDTLVVSHPDYPEVRVPLGSPGDRTWDLTIALIPDPALPDDAR